MFTVDMGKIEFNELGRDILNIIQKIRGGCTKEMLISQLQNLAKELGRVPRQSDLNESSKKNKTRSERLFIVHFGSFNKALKAAGLAPNNSRYSESELIEQLQGLRKELKRTPRVGDLSKMSKQGKIACKPTFQAHFGSFSKALEAASFTPNKSRRTPEEKSAQIQDENLRKKLLDPELLKEQLRNLAKELGRSPKIDDVAETSRVGKTASPNTFWRVFSSFSKALVAAGLNRNTSRYSKNELIEQLRWLGEKLGRKPKKEDLSRKIDGKKMACPAAFTTHFGSFTEALTVAGFKPNKKPPEKEEMIQQLQNLAKNLSKIPSGPDITKASKEGKNYSLSTFVYHFGSLHKAMEAADLPTRETRYIKRMV